ncbi:MAG: L,D-transpeptidase [Apilactobacillus waqarii]|uniref:L,D-transpeptidase n=1 Tax=Apilactobacillus waqarii TaxID=2851006 RepID=UPI003F336934
MTKFKRAFAMIIAAVIVALGLTACGQSTSKSTANKNTTTNLSAQASVRPSKNAWKHSSEKKAYPNMKLSEKNWLDVSIKKQRVYVKNKAGKVLYTMLCSTGNDDGTPRGIFHIQKERGSHFYNASSKEGANYWTSFKNHGIYLFHSVPVNKDGKYLMKDAHELGKVANSHGCVRLSIPDAKWINSSVPTGTMVVIH